ncbi:MAG: DUF2550 domain-containing protein [Nocardioidaceae bacterium]
MPLWQWLLDSGAVVLLLVLLYGALLVARRRWLSRNGGTFEFSVRTRSTRPGHGWALGVGRYTGDDLEWFRIFSLSLRPRFSWPRPSLRYAGRRDPTGAEGYSLYSGHIVVECETPTGVIEVAMSPEALTGFLAWLEAQPPGTRRHL